MSGAPDREPVDSAVRVTPPTQRHGEPSTRNEARGRARSPEAKDEDDPRQAKRRKVDERPTLDDLVVVYDVSPERQETELYTRLRKLVKPEDPFSRHFKAARKLLNQLGPCASDLMWRHVIDGVPLMSRKEEVVPAEVREFVDNWTYDMPNPSPKSSNYNVTSHFSKLVEILQSCETQDPAFRGVVMTKKPITAFMITEMLKLLDDFLPELRPCANTHKGPQISEGEPALDAFKDGAYNLLVTTKHTEVLEVPNLTVIIEYTLFESSPRHLIPQHASEVDSTLVVYMVERNNDIQRRLLERYQAERLSIASADKTGPSSSEAVSASDDEMSDSDYIQDPTTGQHIYRHNALSVVRRFAESQGTNGELPCTQRRDDRKRQICSITAPFGSSSRTIVGSPQPSQVEAKASAAFRLCRELFEHGLLDPRFFPSTPTSAPAPAEVEVEKDGQASRASSTTRCYPRKLPQFWTNTLPMFNGRLYPVVVSVSDFRDGVHAPIVLLTRFWLPEIAEFPVFSSGSRGTVRLTRAAPIAIDQSRLQALSKYTLRLSRAVVNKPITCTAESMFYFFAPLDHTWAAETSQRTKEGFPIISIPWEDVEAAADSWATSLLSDDGKLPKNAEDLVIQDRFVEFTNRYFLAKVRKDLSPLSKPEDDEREAECKSYLEYCKSRRKDFEGLKFERQPLVEVALAPPCVNNLSPSSQQVASQIKFPARHLIPELCFNFTIPASAYRTALLLPSIMHMIDSVLLVKEMNAKLFDNTIREDYLHAAIVCPTAGLQHDYERLELLGDAFIKYATSTYFYVTMPNAREGAMHAARQRLISNKALRAGAIEANVPPFIQSKSLVPKIWQPCPFDSDDSQPDETGDQVVGSGSSTPAPGLNAISSGPGASVAQKQERHTRPYGGKRKRQRDEHVIQWLGDKTVADVVEASIGASYLTGGRDLALQVAKTLNIPLQAVGHWSDFARMPNPFGDSTLNLPQGVITGVETIAGYTFKRPALLAEALAHSSIANNSVRNYDRLEFLGDAVLDFLTVSYLFHKHPNMSPGPLSLLKAAMVSNTTLATICVLSGLYKHLQFASSDLANQITEHVTKIRKLRDEEHKTAQKENRLPCQFWVEEEPPKALSDIVESIMAAMYVNDGFDIASAERFFHDVLTPFFEKHIRLQTLSDHPNTTLTNLFHSESCQQHNVVKHADGSTVRYDVVVHDITLSTASDPLSNSALRKAAMAALDVLAEDPTFMSRVCDCRAKRQTKKAQIKQGKKDSKASEVKVEDAEVGGDDEVRGSVNRSVVGEDVDEDMNKT